MFPALGLKKNHRVYLGIEISLQDLVNKRKTGSVGILNNKLNVHGGFTPAAVAPLNVIAPGSTSSSL